MSVNRGKQFEDIIREQFKKLKNVVTIRLYDVTTGYINQNNICDLIVYDEGTLNLIECKAVHGNTLNFKSHIKQNQWDGLLEESYKPGVNAGILVWFIDHDVTLWLDIQYLQDLKESGYKSFNVKYRMSVYELAGVKKKVFFEYDLRKFLKDK